MNITIWNEFVHEREETPVGELCRKHYPDGMHEYLKNALGALAPEMNFRTASLDQPEHGLTDDVLNSTDVLIWWGHMAHGKVSDDIVAKVHTRVLCGMGLIALHSAHYAKVFTRLMGTSCALRWREIGEKERVWVTAPTHPIANGLPETFVIPNTEMYGEPYDLPNDGKVVLMSWYEGGNVLRSGVAFERDNGKVFYFSPGHETLPIYHDANVQRVILNAIRWAQPPCGGVRAPRVANWEKDPVEEVRTPNPFH